MCYFCVFIGFWWKSPHFPYNSDPWQCLFSPDFFTVGVPTTHPSNILLPKPSKNEALEQVLQLSFDCLKKCCKQKKLERFLYGSIVIFQRMHVFRPPGVEAWVVPS